ncbi:rotamase superfamily protein [Psychroflexus torquis ATCC 700755]|uniref:Rotamase superfamily protein n=1 Tax=Psychroflexus torquis (strain ATCC 700755 / CIP 106069 / ACAM 623) TaxID=313595 RepID=K4IMC6_PSYTT|nr:peptidylprolyl isomerase [Psychroflexus torquis]AFU70226.1 rotamase superfamily protein [Psychroflexus torquis ATCC 700755]
MKVLVLFLIVAIFQLNAQNNLFQHNLTVFDDFGLSEKEIADYKSEGNLSIFNKEKHNSRLASKLFNLKVGQSIKLKKANKKKLKVLKKVDVEHYRLNYIFFDGSQLDYEDIEKQRDKILQMNKTYSFPTLAQMYSMDMRKNVGGDSGWFKKRSTPQDFQDAALSSRRVANETFKVDLISENWYYLILKSYSPILIEEILVLETPL